MAKQAGNKTQSIDNRTLPTEGLGLGTAIAGSIHFTRAEAGNYLIRTCDGGLRLVMQDEAPSVNFLKCPGTCVLRCILVFTRDKTSSTDS
jgi:hypothetical protein